MSHTIQQGRPLSEADRGASPLLRASKLLEELTSRGREIPVQETVRAPDSRSRCRLESVAMRFGLFIPQGWRLDLVDIPVDQQWPVMRDLATYADGSAWDSLWVYDHFHTVPVPTDEATHEAWSMMSAYAAATSRIDCGRWSGSLASIAISRSSISPGSGTPSACGVGGGWRAHLARVGHTRGL